MFFSDKNKIKIGKFDIRKILYTYTQQEDNSKFNIKEAFKNNLSAYQKLYQLIITLIFFIKQTAREEIAANKKKFLATSKDLNPNQKFVKNQIFKSIREQPVDIDKNKLKSIAKKIFRDFKKSNSYKEYMAAEESSYEIDKKIIIFLLKKHIVNNPKIDEFLEENSIYWNDDLIIVYNTFIEKINNQTTINTTKAFRAKEDELFAKNLLQNTIKNESGISKTIYQLADNWDKDRIALIDLILMRMAISEMIHIKNIPHKVTLDEYIEISKYYSTPKSKEFINGV